MYDLGLDQLKYQRSWMENIYNSAKFCKDAWNHPKCYMVSGVVRKGLNEIPDCIIQDECTTPISEDRTQVTVKDAVLEKHSEYKGLIAVSVYDR